MVRRLQIFYTISVVSVLCQAALGLYLVRALLPTMAKMFEGVSLKLPLPTEILLTLGKTRLPLSAGVILGLGGCLVAAWRFRPHPNSRGQVSLTSTYLITGLQLAVAALLALFFLSAFLPFQQLFGPPLG